MMKKLLLCLVALVAATFGMNAKIGEPIAMPDHDYEFIPAKFSADNTVSLLFMNYDDGVSTGRIYSKDMQIVKNISVSNGASVTASRTVQHALNVPVNITEQGRDSYPEAYELAEDQLAEYFISRYGVEFEEKDGAYYYPYSKDDWRCNDFYYECEYYGAKYPRQYFTYSAEESTLYGVQVWYNYETWGFVGWSEPMEEEVERVPGLQEMFLLTEYSSDTYDLYFTQHLFNNDDLYEYIMPLYTKTSMSYATEWEKVSGESVICNGFKVLNENGAAVTTVEFPAGYFYDHDDLYIRLIDLDDIYYIAVGELQNGSGDEYTLMYRVDPETNSVKAVSEPIRTKVSPTAPKAGTPVRVELGGAAGQNARVSLIGESGQTVWSKALQPGATTTSIETSHLKKGVYVVVVSDGKSSHESTKIIVR